MMITLKSYHLGKVISPKITLRVAPVALNFTTYFIIKHKNSTFHNERCYQI